MANMGGAAPEIGLDEVSRLIRMLGMLGSASDHEALVAARFVVRWVEQHQTDWETLLVPEEPMVTGVAVAVDSDEIEGRLEDAYQRGYQAGAAQQQAQQAGMAAQMRAHAAQQAAASHWTVAGMSGIGSLGAALSGLGPSQGPVRGQTTRTAPRTGPAANTGSFSTRQGAAAGPAGPPPQGPPPWAQGSWQWVCKELLNRMQAGIPGVFRNGKEEQFVADVLGRGYATLTTAQEVWLRDIAARNGLSW